MKLALLSVFLALPLLLPAQTAKVIQLSPEDATKAAALYQQKADIEKQITDLEEKITESYLKGKADSYFCGVGYICGASPAPTSGAAAAEPEELIPEGAVAAARRVWDWLKARWRQPPVLPLAVGAGGKPCALARRSSISYRSLSGEM